MTLLERLIDSFKDAQRTPDGMASPVALLWTDPERQWQSLIPQLHTALPGLYVWGKYAPDQRTGPAIWLRCIVDGLVERAQGNGATPILYLPGLSRQVLQGIESCPKQWLPLIELQFRGRVWHQPNGRDWTVTAFLCSEAGLGLEVAQDRKTEEAGLRSLPALAALEVAILRGRRLDAGDFDRLSVSDPVRDLLRWMDDPAGFKNPSEPQRWDAFRSICKKQYAFDPGSDGVKEAAGRLAAASDGPWNELWKRFCDAPRLYPSIAKLLREPFLSDQGRLGLNPERSPRINDEKESELRQALSAVAGLPHAEACARTIELEKAHCHRREWVWAQIGQSPWALALEPLAMLARLAQTPVGGATVESIAKSYACDGWRCDRAAMDALAQFGPGNDAVQVGKVVRTLYEPWLDRSARHFQGRLYQELNDLKSHPLSPGLQSQIEGEKAECLLFVDGLRFDIAGWLAEVLTGRGLSVQLRHRLAPVPSVTATAKPAIAPVADNLHGSNGSEFLPLLGSKPATSANLRESMTTAGVQVIGSEEDLFPKGAPRGGWSECGRIDQLGHSMKVELPRRLRDEVERIAAHVLALLEAGWRQVRVVTDHGWLLLPEGLPKVELPTYLTATRWARCAVVTGKTELPTLPWHWNASVEIASPPGIGCFRAGEEYAHGGISPQECVVPDIVVQRGAAAPEATIRSIQWRGMRCRVEVDTNTPEIEADIRLEWNDPATSVAFRKRVGPSGEVSLLVEDDRHEGHKAFAALLGIDGNVLDRRETTVGKETGT